MHAYIHIHVQKISTPPIQIAALVIPGLQFPTPCLGLRRSPGSAAGRGGSAVGATQPMAAGDPVDFPQHPPKKWPM